MSNDSKVLVVGGTGTQGGSVARALVERDVPVRVLTRDPQKAEAQGWTAQGVEVVTGNLEDRAALDAAMVGVSGVFSVQTSYGPDGLAAEVRQGKNVADAAKAAGVRHLVYSSVGGADRNTGIPHFESKWEIENYIRALDLPATILRPVAFMENYRWAAEAIRNGVFSGFGLGDTKTLQLIAARDIGQFAAIAFSDPDRWVGRSVEIAGDELTEPQIAETFARVLGREVIYSPPPASTANAIDDRNLMIEWFKTSGYEADIPALRQIHPDVWTLEQWAHVAFGV